MRTLMMPTFLALTLVACSGGEERSLGPHSTQNPDSAPATMVPVREYAFVATCATSTAEHCLGGYGLTVRSDGTYRIGPGPQGQVLEGHVDPADLVTITAADDDAASIQAIQKVAPKYYPAAFPNPCVNALDEVKHTYDQVGACDTDDECTLLARDLTPLEPGRRAEREDACTFLPALPAANSFRAVSRQLELVLTRRVVATVCGADLKPPYCSPASSLRPAAGHRAACVQNRCVAIH